MPHRHPTLGTVCPPPLAPKQPFLEVGHRTGRRWLPAALACWGLLGLVSAPALALSPPMLDGRTDIFADTWQGLGRFGAFCLLRLEADGSGTALIDPGNGQWLGAALAWTNSHQTVMVQAVHPLVLDAAAHRAMASRQVMTENRRLATVPHFALQTQMNNYLWLQWGPKAEESCHLVRESALNRQHLDAKELLGASRPQPAAPPVAKPVSTPSSATGTGVRKVQP